MTDEGGSGAPCKYYAILSYDRHIVSCTYKSSIHNSCSMFNQACVKKSLCIRIISTVNHFASVNNPHTGYYGTAIDVMNPTRKL